MGYNTAILILNDALGELENNPAEFCEKLITAISSFKETTISVGCHCNPVQVMQTQHADDFKVYTIQGNLMIDMTEYNQSLLDKCKLYPSKKEQTLERVEMAMEKLIALKNTLEKI